MDMALLDKYSLYCEAKLRHPTYKNLYHYGSSQLAAEGLLIFRKSSSMAIGLTTWGAHWNGEVSQELMELPIGPQPTSPDVKGSVRQGWVVD